jgi:hypothetical protein
MNDPYRPLTAPQVLDLYFIENRSRVLDIASFLDRIDRYAGADEARAEYRYQALMRTLRLLVESPGDRTRADSVVAQRPDQRAARQRGRAEGLGRVGRSAA